MTIIICKVQSGMCNRIIPFITSYRLAMNLGLKFYLCWDDNCTDLDYEYKGIKTKYSDMFQKIDNVNYIEDYEINELLKNKNTLQINYCEKILKNYDINDLLKYDIIFYNKYVHPIFIKEDNINIKSYGNDNLDWIIQNSEYLQDIQKYFKMLKPIYKLQKAINEILIKFPNDNNIIGFHIRHWPNNWKNECNEYKKYIEKKENIYYDLIDKYIEHNSNIKFYICSSDLKIIQDLVKKYNNRIIYFEQRLGDTLEHKYYNSNQTISYGNIYKNLNGIIDLYLLSNCKIVYGENYSSYSLCAPLLNSKLKYNRITI
jgi:hypothetical protein